MRRLLVALALVGTSLAVAAASATAGPYTTFGPVLASPGSSLFAPGCGGSGEGGGAFLYQNSEVEPWFVVNPTNPENLVGFIQQDRWSDGGAHGLQVLVSDNAGGTWARTDSPDFSRCAGAEQGDPGYYERSSDPWLSFSPNGRLHAISLSTDRSTARNAVLASFSDDGGDSWSTPRVIRADNSRSGPLANLFNDKESITADPANSAYVYAVWDRIASPNENPLTPPQAYANSLAWHGPAWFARSTDNGLTWETAHPIFAPKASRTQTIGNQIVVHPDGTVIDGFNYIVSSQNRRGIRGDNVGVIFSDDHGETWSDVTLVAKMGDRGVRDPEPVEQCRPDQPAGALCTLVRTGDILPEFAVDWSDTDTRGNVYAVWQSHQRGVTAQGRPVDDTIMLARSTDGGHTWDDPIQVSETPEDIYNGQAFTSSVDVAANGDVAVTYYDFRNDEEGDDALSTDYWIVHSHDGGQTFGDEARLTDESFDMRKAPYARGYFVGDYEGLDHSGNVFQPFFVQTYDVDAIVSGNMDSANRTDAFWSTAGP
jgi:BNR repeat-like domain